MSKSVRIPDRSYEQADELRQRGYESLTNVIAVALDRLYQQEIAMRQEYQLDIYTWPAMSGINPEIRTTYHDKPEEALAHVESQKTPYAYATLQQKTQAGYAPCGWKGERIGHNETWPRIDGTNRQHPKVTALKKDWHMLVEMVRARHQTSENAMIDIALEILKQRHPDIVGYAEHLAWDAAE